jgi:hypothetical protein
MYWRIPWNVCKTFHPRSAQKRSRHWRIDFTKISFHGTVAPTYASCEAVHLAIRNAGRRHDLDRIRTLNTTQTQNTILWPRVFAEKYRAKRRSPRLNPATICVIIFLTTFYQCLISRNFSTAHFRVSGFSSLTHVPLVTWHSDFRPVSGCLR